MSRILGAVLAGLLALQAGLPSVGLAPPWQNVAALAVGVAVAALAFYLKGPTTTQP